MFPYMLPESLIKTMWNIVAKRENRGACFHTLDVPYGNAMPGKFRALVFCSWSTDFRKCAWIVTIHKFRIEITIILIDSMCSPMFNQWDHLNHIVFFIQTSKVKPSLRLLWAFVHVTITRLSDDDLNPFPKLGAVRQCQCAPANLRDFFIFCSTKSSEMKEDGNLFGRSHETEVWVQREEK